MQCEELNVKLTLRIALALSVAGYAFPGQVAKDFHPNNSANNVTVVVQFTGPPTTALLNQLTGNGASTKKQFTKIPTMLVISASPKQIPAIAALPGVKRVTPDREVHKHLDTTAATVGSTLANQYGWTGRGVGVAIIDSGISLTNADVKSSNGASRVVYSEVFPGRGTTADKYGHGSHVAGIVAGNGANSFGKYQ